jgi:hypothetical protein
MPGQVRVLVVASVRVDPATFSACLRSLRSQLLPKGVTLDLHFILDDPDPKPLQKLIKEHKGTWEQAPERPQDALYGVGPQTHAWNLATFDHLARNKQKLLDHAKAERYDYVWVCDTDLICDPRTLASMLSLREPVVSAVFWTPWQHGAAPMPQVWLAQPYEQQGKGMSMNEFWDKLTRRRAVAVAGGGACMLVDTKVLKRVHYHPRLEGLPNEGMWQGEDRTFAILCERFHINQWADAWPDIVHAYHSEQRQPEALENTVAALCGPRQTQAKYGDLVSFTLESLDEPGMQGRLLPIRGRLGGLGLAPELEDALLDMEVGTERFVEISFPMTWPVEPLRGQQRVVALRFVDAKPWSFAPMIADHMFKGVQNGAS